MKINLDKGKGLLYYGITVFILNSVMRDSIGYMTGLKLPGLFGTVNILAIISVVLVYIFCLDDFISVKQWILLIIVLIYCSLVYISYLEADVNSRSAVGPYVLWTSIFPAMALMLLNYDKIDIKWLFSTFLKIYDTILIVVFLFGILDYFLGGVINNFIAAYMSDPTWAQMIYTENATYGFRMCTILGSPLINAYYALVLMVLNKVYYHEYNEKIVNMYIIYIISIAAIILTGSRSALFIGVAFILISELLGKWGIWKVLVVLIAFAMILNTSLFQETVGARLQIGFMNESDARYKLWVAFLNHQFGKVNFFIGGGYNYSRWLTATQNAPTMNFEYPFLMFLYDYGILATILYYIMFAVYPIIVFIKNKSYYVMFGYVMIFAFLQTFNGIAQYYDFNLQLGFIIILLINVIGIPKQAGREEN